MCTLLIVTTACRKSFTIYVGTMAQPLNVKYLSNEERTRLILTYRKIKKYILYSPNRRKVNTQRSKQNDL